MTNFGVYDIPFPADQILPDVFPASSVALTPLLAVASPWRRTRYRKNADDFYQ